MALTFKNLQDKVLGWLDEANDSTVVLANVKEAIAAANARRAASYEWPFMLAEATGVLIPGISKYKLADDVRSMLCIMNETKEQQYREMPLRHFKQGATIDDGFIFDGAYITLLFTPDSADTVNYYYYKNPKELSGDDDLPDIPYPFSRVLIYDALIDLGNYSEDITPQKLSYWRDKQQEYEADLLAARMNPNSLGAHIHVPHVTNWDNAY